MPSSPGSDPTLGRRFARLTAVNILTNLTVPLVGLVDTAMLGHLDEIRFLAGVALGSILFDYIYWSFGFLRMGSTGMTAQARGRGDETQVYEVLYRFLLVGAGIGGALLVLQWPLGELGFLLLSGSSGVEAAGRDYFFTRIWGAPAALCNFAFLGWFLGREQPGRALAMTFVGNLANVGLNYLFIVRLGQAAAGAGRASAAANYVMLAVALILWVRLGRPTAWRWRSLLERRGLTSLLTLNRDILIRTFCLQTAFAVFINFSALMGVAVLAANAILNRVLMLAAYFVDGAAFAAESLAGHAKGAGSRTTFRRLARLSLTVGPILAALFLAAYFAARRPLLSLLTSHRDVLDAAMGWDLWLIPVLMLGSWAYVLDGLFLGLTEGRRLRNAMIASTLLVFLPLACAALYLESVPLLWAAMAAFMAARGVTLAVGLRQAGSFA